MEWFYHHTTHENKKGKDCQKNKRGSINSQLKVIVFNGQAHLVYGKENAQSPPDGIW
jgi:hypothetical protein